MAARGPAGWIQPSRAMIASVIAFVPTLGRPNAMSPVRTPSSVTAARTACFDPGRRRLETETEPEHQRRTQESGHTDWRYPGPRCRARCRRPARTGQTDAPCGSARAEAGRREHAERAADHRHLVGEDVAEHVFREEHVELVRVARELHRGVVHIHVRQLDIGMSFREVPRHGLAPEDARSRGRWPCPPSRRVRCARSRGDGRDFGDALDLAGLVNHRVDRLTVAVLERGGGLGLAEINAAGQLADAHDVDAVGDAFDLQRRRVDQFGIKQTGAEVGEKVEGLAQRQQGGAFRLFLGRQFFPLRAADRTKQDRVRLPAERERGVGQGLAVAVDARSADLGDLVMKREALLAGHVGEHAQGLGHHFGTDVVSWQDGELQRRHG